MENGGYLTFIVSFVLSISSVIMFAACLCCRKKVRSNELLGLEGMMKIKNPDENLLNGNHVISGDPNPKTSTSSDTIDAKRTSTAAHRSLPDIPVSDPNQLDTNSDLYATVGDKVGEKPQGHGPPSNNKKPISVSQHSSISQPDDCSSPYARVRSPSHAYDKVRPAEHPYAQLKVADANTNRPLATVASTSTSATNNSNNNNVETNGIDGESLSRRGSQQSLLDAIDGRSTIPAASAIAGRVSASQELPYMTPPIVQNQQFFSGDSQDSSKGYTSISVREPLANIIAQTKKQNAQARRRDMTDSHYATVSDDSDEMYAAIEDPTNQADLYTSGSETYAQIQPQETVVVSVEINTLQTISPSVSPPIIHSPVAPIVVNHVTFSNQMTNLPNSIISSPRHSIVNDEPSTNPTPVDILKAAHSRQASSSSCTSSVGNLGSPKPEKRQANSPLPPTPKTSHIHHQSTSSLIQSGRNSSASVIEVPNNRQVSRENLSASMDGSVRVDDEPRKNRLSKDLEGMYAKVMKKNKLSSAPSQNTSPVPSRKTLVIDTQQQQQQPPQPQPLTNRQSVFLSDPDITREIAMVDSRSVHASPTKNSTKSTQNVEDNNYETIDKRRTRSSNAHYGDSKDPGYETIPGDKTSCQPKRNNLSRASAPPGICIDDQPVFTPVTNYGAGSSEPGYESLPDQSLLSNDPGYETVEPVPSTNVTLLKPHSDYDPNYEELRPANVDNVSDHYAKVWSKSAKGSSNDANDGYSSIKPIKKKIVRNTLDVDDDEDNPAYCTISNPIEPIAPTTDQSDHDYACITGDAVYSSIAEKSLTTSTTTHNPLTTSMCSTMSETKTLTSPSSDGSAADGTSSTDTPIRYKSIRSNTELTVSVSNYESLTGSESDSNYESVRYLNAADKGNPYERLHNENDLKYDTLKRDVAGLHNLSPQSNSSDSNCNLNNNNNNNYGMNNKSSFSQSNSSSSNISGNVCSTSKSDGKISSSSSTNLNSNSDASDLFQV